MNKSILAVGIIFLSLLALLLINVLTNYSTGSELDYYLVKETTDAAMKDALDMSYYWNCGMYRIDKEKFVESFLYRFADSGGHCSRRRLVPRLLRHRPGRGRRGNADAAQMSTSYDAILETNYKNDEFIKTNLANANSDICKIPQ